MKRILMLRLKLIQIASILLLVLFFKDSLHAASKQEPSKPQQPQMVSLVWENDTWYDTDQSYTNGLRLTWAKMQTKESFWWLPDDQFSKWFKRCGGGLKTDCFEWWTGGVVGQSMYTPQNIKTPILIDNDRPYGGWCYLGTTFSAIRRGTRKEKAAQHTFDFLTGVVGEPSFGEETQTFVHEHIATGAPEPKGWSHQIATEATLNFQYSGRRREVEKKVGSHRVFDVASEWTTAFGNAFIYAGGGSTIRIGWNLGEDFGASRIEPSISWHEETKQNWELYGFFRFGTRTVMHNIFLDGGWFADSEHTVDKKHLVGDAEVGVTFRILPAMLSFRWVQRSPEFKERRIVQQYGTLSLTLLF